MKLRKLQRLAVSLGVCGLCSTPPVGAAAVDSVVAVGEDGNSYYEVTCDGGSVASVVVSGSRQEVCIYADHLGRSCRADWTVDNAAAYACRSAPLRNPVP